MVATDSARSLIGDDDVLLVSHGYENIYERGFCNGLHDAGIGFTLISSDQTDYAGLRAGTRCLNLRGSQLPNRPRWSKAATMLRYHLSLMWHVARRRPAVLHVIGLIEPAWLCGVLEGLWFRLWAGRYVLTVHDTEPHDVATAWSRRLFALSFRIASRLVVHTDAVRRQLVEGQGIAAERITVMQHGIEPQATAVASPAPGCRPDPLRLLVFGKVMRYKGIDLLLDALRDLPVQPALTIAGRCSDAALEAELRARISAHPHANSIRWDNAYVAESQIPGLFTEADALVLAYRRIDQSGVLFQGLRFGLPVVAARVGALARYVEPEVGECFDAGDAGSLREALLRLLHRYPSIDRERVRAIGRRYEWQRCVGVLAPLYAAGVPQPLPDA